MPASFSSAESAAMCSSASMADDLTLMPVAQRFIPQPVSAPFSVCGDSRIVVPGRYEDQPLRPLTAGSVYVCPECGRGQLPDYTVAYRSPV
jgi:hypothetical protein